MRAELLFVLCMVGLFAFGTILPKAQPPVTLTSPAGSGTQPAPALEAQPASVTLRNAPGEVAPKQRTRTASWLLQMYEDHIGPGAGKHGALTPSQRRDWDLTRREMTEAWWDSRGIQILAPMTMDHFQKGTGEGSSALSVRGVRATGPIRVNDVLSVTPFNALISRLTVQSSPIGHVFGGHASTPVPKPPPQNASARMHQNAASPQAVKMDDSLAIAVWLMWEVAQLRKWLKSDGLDSPAVSVPVTGPTNWSGHVLDLMVTPLNQPQLKTHNIIQALPKVLRAMALEKVSANRKKYRRIMPLLTERFPDVFAHRGFAHTAADFSFDQFQWALAVWNSRNFQLDQFGESEFNFMSPGADMQNMCHNLYPTRVVMKWDGSFVMTAVENITKGDEVCFFYGQHCREDSMMMYGFSAEWQAPCPEKKVREKDLIEENL